MEPTVTISLEQYENLLLMQRAVHQRKSMFCLEHSAFGYGVISKIWYVDEGSEDIKKAIEQINKLQEKIRDLKSKPKTLIQKLFNK